MKTPVVLGISTLNPKFLTNKGQQKVDWDDRLLWFLLGGIYTAAIIVL